MDKRKDSAVGIIPVYKKPDGEFLFCIVQHADLHWGFPKGHMEPGESDEQAARRELKEETGVEKVELVPGKLFSEQYSFESNGMKYEKTVSYFIGLVQGLSDVTPDAFKNEILEVRWFSYEDTLRTLTFPEGKKKMLEEVLQYVHERLE